VKVQCAHFGYSVLAETKGQTGYESQVAKTQHIVSKHIFIRNVRDGSRMLQGSYRKKGQRSCIVGAQAQLPF